MNREVITKGSFIYLFLVVSIAYGLAISVGLYTLVNTSSAPGKERNKWSMVRLCMLKEIVYNF